MFYAVYIPELCILAILLCPPVRQILISGPMQRWVRRTLPPISSTEQEAIAAGDRWIEAELFQAQWRLPQQLNRPRVGLSPQEQEFMDGPLQQLCSMINDWEIVHKHWELPEEIWTFLKKNKFLGLIIQKKYGGRGFSAQAHSTIVATVATKSPSVAVVVMVPNSLGPGELLMHYGTEDQKQYYLPRLALGEEIPCFALTGIDAGSDASAMSDYGIVSKNTQGVIGLRLFWNKRYITLAPVATIMGLAFKLFDPEALLSDHADRGITVCLIPTNHPGVNIGRRHNPLGMAFPNGPTSGSDVWIPLDWIIGGPERIGQGWKMLVECLSIGRGISLPSLATAIGQLSTFHSAAYSVIREQFRVPIQTFEGIQDPLGRMAGMTYLLESARQLTVSGIDAGIRPSVVSAIAKYHMTEMGRKIINDAMDLHGGKAIILGPRNILAHGYIATPISITVEGANILTRSLMIFGQGAIRCHPYLLQEMNTAVDDHFLSEFDRHLFNHIAYTNSNIIRGMTMGWTCGKIFHDATFYPDKKSLQAIELLSLALSVASDLSFARYGGALKRQESLSARLGDVLSYLYLAVSVIDRHAREKDLAADRSVVQWTLQYCFHQAQEAFFDFSHNVSPCIMGSLLRCMFFPWGRRYKAPSDALTHQIAREIAHPGPLLDKLTSLLPKMTVGDPLAVLREAFTLKETIQEPLKAFGHWQKSQLAIIYAMSLEQQYNMAIEQGIIKTSQLQDLMRYEMLKKDIVMTDDQAADERL
jgi:alkylation response protein AidB-like acyl-CoA dehydrogenase